MIAQCGGKSYLNHVKDQGDQTVELSSATDLGGGGAKGAPGW